jgi:hypothetical protein
VAAAVTTRTVALVELVVVALAVIVTLLVPPER